MPLLKKFETEGSQLTPLTGNQPSAPLKNAGTIPVNNTFSKGTYIDFVSETPRAVDTTGNVQ
ncbi:MAG: hypothetical protein GY817_09505 [bacterium]|jgi:hypothetical protein|nr:hypothetical protein [bacterium]|tara:strand:+ start:147 stop:332 length:186 start_codon:yes stop_codon:yes gene_type:complete